MTSSWMVPVAVELVLTLLFCGVLISLRRSLKTSGIVLWMLLWAGRSTGTILAVRYFSGAPDVLAFVYAPVQIAFALAIVAVALRLESQKQQLRSLNSELERLRRETSENFDRDPLTGLLNRAALDRWIDQGLPFDGMVVVCDMDDFKRLNDEFGHLVGDEILNGVGKLVRASIREDDRAFRWGGDELVIFFQNQDMDVVEARMRSIEERLRSFQIRRHGPMAVRLSWGIAAAAGRSVREAIADADTRMYQNKPVRRSTGSIAGE